MMNFARARTYVHTYVHNFFSPIRTALIPFKSLFLWITLIWLVLSAGTIVLLPQPNAIAATQPTQVPTTSLQVTIPNQGNLIGLPEVPDISVFRIFGDVDGDGDLDGIAQRDTLFNYWLWLNDGFANGIAQFTPAQPLTAFGDRTFGFAFGDLDGEGSLDLVLGNRDTPNQVWLNDGAGHLTLAQADLGTSDTRSVQLGDVDGDGDLDVVFANASTTGNELWFNDGSGTLVDMHAFGSSSQDLGLADLDGDGDLDMLFGNLFGPGTEFWRNDGLGNFALELYPVSTPTRRIKLADLDDDGDIDAAFANQFGVPNQIWLNDGTATFTISQSLSYSDSKAVQVGDLDGDGDLDLIFANNMGKGNEIWFNDGSAHFTKIPPFGRSVMRDVVVWDVDQDGDLDATFEVLFDLTAAIWLNQTNQGMPGIGLFQGKNPISHDSIVAPTAKQPIVVVDLAVSAPVQDTDVPSTPAGEHLFRLNCCENGYHAYPSSPQDRVLQALDTTELPFIQSDQLLAQADGYVVKLADLDRDGDLDAAIANVFAEKNEIWFNDGDGHFSKSQLFGQGYTTGIALGDLDEDGDLDMVTANRDRGNGIWLNNGNGRFAVVQEVDSSYDSRAVAQGDIDGDGDVDIIFSNAFGGRLRVWLNDGTALFTYLPQEFGEPIGRIDNLALGDLDADGDLDLIFTNAFKEGNEVWFNDGTGYFSLVQGGLGIASTRNIALEDLDNDGDLDAVFANTAGQGSEVWFNDGTGYLALGGSLGTGSNLGLALGDVDKDGDLDIAFADTTFAGNEVWLNDGSGNFRLFALLGDVEAKSVAMGDMNGDGRPDLIFANFGFEPNTIWFNNPRFIFPE